MNKDNFLKELAFLLQDISDEDREDALQYYEDYFVEAGSENEGKVLAELQTPERVAALIKAGLNAQFEETIEYSESSMGNSSYNRNQEVIIPDQEAYQSEDTNPKSEYTGYREQREEPRYQRKHGLLWILLVAALIMFAIPTFGVGFGLLIAVLAIIFSLGLVFGVLGVVFAICSVLSFVRAMMMLTTYPGAAMIVLGTGLILLSLTIFMFKNIKKPFQIIPVFFRECIELIREFIRKVGGKI